MLARGEKVSSVATYTIIPVQWFPASHAANVTLFYGILLEKKCNNCEYIYDMNYMITGAFCFQSLRYETLLT